MVFVFLHLTYFTQYDSLGPSVLLQMVLFYSFLWLSIIPLYICTTFLYPFLCQWHLGCFRVLAIVNGAAVNIGVCVSFQIVVFSGS